MDAQGDPKMRKIVLCGNFEEVCGYFTLYGHYEVRETRILRFGALVVDNGDCE